MEMAQEQSNSRDRKKKKITQKQSPKRFLNGVYNPLGMIGLVQRLIKFRYVSNILLWVLFNK